MPLYKKDIFFHFNSIRHNFVKMDLLYVICLITLAVNVISSSKLLEPTKQSRMVMPKEQQLIYSNITYSWEDAYDFCYNKRARMITAEEASHALSGESFWIGSYKAQTKFITDLGCHDLNEESLTDVSSVNNAEINVPLCFFYCITNEKVTTNYFALKGTTCFCIPELNDAKFTLGCSNQCADEESICGGKETYSVYRIEYSIEVDRTVGFCRTTSYPYNDSNATSCSRPNFFYCKEKHKEDGEIQYLKSWSTSIWESARTSCYSKTSLGSRFSQVDVSDFKDGRISDSEEKTYWVSTRVYTQNLKQSDQYAGADYLYECDVWNETSKMRNQVGCVKRKHKAICIRDPPSQETTVPVLTEASTLALDGTVPTRDNGNLSLGNVFNLNEGENIQNTKGMNISLTLSVSGAVLVLIIIIVLVLVINRKRKEKSSLTDKSNGKQREPMLPSNSTTPRTNNDNYEENYDVVREDKIQINAKDFRNSDVKIKNNYDEVALGNTEYSKATRNLQHSVSVHQNCNDDYEKPSSVMPSEQDSEYSVSSHHKREDKTEDGRVIGDDLYDGTDFGYSSTTFRKNEQGFENTYDTSNI